MVLKLTTSNAVATAWDEFRRENPLKGMKPVLCVAHAMGGIDGQMFTNSVEAFEENYDKGFRHFEVDLILTKDGRLAGAHDWSYLGQTPTYAEFIDASQEGDYTPIDNLRLMQLMADYPDSYIVTDTKSTEPGDIAMAFKRLVARASEVDVRVLERMIPQVYNPEMYDIVCRIHPFREIIYALYLSPQTDEEVVRFVSERGIKAVSMPFDRADAPFLKALKAAGAKVYVHTINDPAQARELILSGVDGIYTDFIFMPENN